MARINEVEIGDYVLIKSRRFRHYDFCHGHIVNKEKRTVRVITNSGRFMNIVIGRIEKINDELLDKLCSQGIWHSPVSE